MIRLNHLVNTNLIDCCSVLLEAPGIPSAPVIVPADVAEGSTFTVTCSGDVGSPFGSLDLISNGATLKDFLPVVGGCGAVASTCFRYESVASLTDARNAENRWTLPAAIKRDDGLQLWCRAVHAYAPEKPLSSTATTLRVLCMPRANARHFECCLS